MPLQYRAGIVAQQYFWVKIYEYVFFADIPSSIHLWTLKTRLLLACWAFSKS